MNKEKNSFFILRFLNMIFFFHSMTKHCRGQDKVLDISIFRDEIIKFLPRFQFYFKFDESKA